MELSKKEFWYLFSIVRTEFSTVESNGSKTSESDESKTIVSDKSKTRKSKTSESDEY